MFLGKLTQLLFGLQAEQYARETAIFIAEKLVYRFLLGHLKSPWTSFLFGKRTGTQDHRRRPEVGPNSGFE